MTPEPDFTAVIQRALREAAETIKRLISEFIIQP